MTLVYSTGEEVVNVPTSWHDVSFNQYCKLVNNDQMDGDRVDLLNRISIITGISIDDLKQCKADTITAFLNCISFMSDHEPITRAAKLLPDIDGFDYNTFDFGSTEYGYFEETKQLLKYCNDNKLNHVNIGGQLVEIYTRKRIDGKEVPGMDISNKPIIEVIGLVNFFLSKLESSLNDTRS